MHIAIEPIGKPRMTRADKWKKRDCVLRYRAFCDELRLKLRALPAPLDMQFTIRMPHTWSERKKARMEGQPHCTKPDLDNMVKAVLDAMLEDDSVVHEFHASKRWGRAGSIFFNPGIKGA